MTRPLRIDRSILWGRRVSDCHRSSHPRVADGHQGARCRTDWRAVRSRSPVEGEEDQRYFRPWSSCHSSTAGADPDVTREANAARSVLRTAGGACGAARRGGGGAGLAAVGLAEVAADAVFARGAVTERAPARAGAAAAVAGTGRSGGRRSDGNARSRESQKGQRSSEQRLTGHGVSPSEAYVRTGGGHRHPVAKETEAQRDSSESHLRYAAIGGGTLGSSVSPSAKSFRRTTAETIRQVWRPSPAEVTATGIASEKQQGQPVQVPPQPEECECFPGA